MNVLLRYFYSEGYITIPLAYIHSYLTQLVRYHSPMFRPSSMVEAYDIKMFKWAYLFKFPLTQTTQALNNDEFPARSVLLLLILPFRVR